MKQYGQALAPFRKRREMPAYIRSVLISMTQSHALATGKRVKNRSFFWVPYQNRDCPGQMSAGVKYYLV